MPFTAVQFFDVFTRCDAAIRSPQMVSCAVDAAIVVMPSRGQRRRTARGRGRK
jgi:hypothetical protein